MRREEPEAPASRSNPARLPVRVQPRLPAQSRFVVPLASGGRHQAPGLPRSPVGPAGERRSKVNPLEVPELSVLCPRVHLRM